MTTAPKNISWNTSFDTASSHRSTRSSHQSHRKLGEHVVSSSVSPCCVHAMCDVLCCPDRLSLKRDSFCRWSPLINDTVLKDVMRFFFCAHVLHVVYEHNGTVPITASSTGATLKFCATSFHGKHKHDKYEKSATTHEVPWMYLRYHRPLLYTASEAVHPAARRNGHWSNMSKCHHPTATSDKNQKDKLSEITHEDWNSSATFLVVSTSSSLSWRSDLIVPILSSSKSLSIDTEKKPSNSRTVTMERTQTPR